MSQRLVELLIGWTPFIVLIGLWVFLMRRGGWLGKHRQHVERNIELLEQQQALLQRIAVALEERNRRAEK